MMTGERLSSELSAIARKRSEADMHERMARDLRREAAEQERLLEQARLEIPTR